MIDLERAPGAAEAAGHADRVFQAAAPKIAALAARWNPGDGSPVFTAAGRYSSRGWTEWTQGFQFGSALLVFEAGGDRKLLESGKTGVFRHMAPHLTHTGVHDHGFNNISTYGNILRMMREGALPEDPADRRVCELALKVSGAVQAARWTRLPDELGYIPSFNGPHSLFADTIRSLRVLALSHSMGHILMGEKDRRISLLRRLLQHAEATARFNVFFGKGRDRWDVSGRVAHESIFNLNDGSYRCPSSQQGYSPFTTWTRGLAWILLGFAELLEFLAGLDEAEFPALGLPYFPHKDSVIRRFEETAVAVADFYIRETPADGVPYWDYGAPELHRLGDYRSRPADPFNDWEPVDSSSAAIAAQGLLRLGACLGAGGRADEGKRFTAAGLLTAASIMGEPYLSRDPKHEGLLLHSVYHRPNGWDFVPPGRKIPSGEACMWGDYHLLELALYLKRLGAGATPPRFYTI